MAWVFYCEGEATTLSAPTKEELAKQVIDHMAELHGTDLSMTEAMAMVNESAKEQAA